VCRLYSGIDCHNQSKRRHLSARLGSGSILELQRQHLRHSPTQLTKHYSNDDNINDTHIHIHIIWNNISKKAEGDHRDVLPAQVSYMSFLYRLWKLTEFQLAPSPLYPYQCLPDFHLPLLHIDLLPEPPLRLLFLPSAHPIRFIVSLE